MSETVESKPLLGRTLDVCLTGNISSRCQSASVSCGFISRHSEGDDVKKVRVCTLTLGPLPVKSH